MRNPMMSILAVVITALEEAALRTTLVWRDKMMREVVGQRERRDYEEQLLHEDQSASAAASMFHEVTSIVTCRVAYLLFRPHRFVFNFGYGFDEGDPRMSSVRFPSKHED